MLDGTKTLLFVALMLTLVLILTTSGNRPTASAPLDGSTPVDESQHPSNATDPVTPSWATNLAPAVQYPQPLLLVMPVTGQQGDLS